MKLCEYLNKEYQTNFIVLIAANLYGPGDNFDPNTSHVIPGLIRKYTEAKKKNSEFVEIWGTGKVKRDFLYIKDCADACYYFMQNYDSKDLPAFINIGSGNEVSIRELAQIIKKKVGYNGVIKWNTSVPDGIPRKFIDTTLANSRGWQAKIALTDGIKKTIDWYNNVYRANY